MDAVISFEFSLGDCSCDDISGRAVETGFAVMVGEGGWNGLAVFVKL